MDGSQSPVLDMPRLPKRMVCLLAAAGITLSFPQGGRAQDASAYHLGEVVVTSTRQAEDLYEHVGNIGIVDRDRIDATAPKRPSEILNQIPGVNIQQGSGEEHTTAIRSPVLNGGAAQGSFLFLEDGIPLRAAGFGNVNGLYEANLDQAQAVEIIRGPGSALYGSNAVHGMINVLPRAPSKTPQSALDISGGSYGQAKVLAEYSDTLGSNGFRLTARTDHDDGWRDSTRLDQQKIQVRDVWQRGADTLTFGLLLQNLDQETGAYINGRNVYRNWDLAKTNPVPDAYRKAASMRGMARWQSDVADDMQISVTPYFRHTEMDFMMHYLPSRAIQKNAHDSIGLQNAIYKDFAGGHKLILGADLEYTDGWYSEFQNLATFTLGTSQYPQGVHYDFDAKALVAAPYVHGEWQALENTRITAGLRLEETYYQYDNKTADGIVGLYQRPADRNDSFTTITPKLGVTQRLAEKLSAYGNLTRGARAPQITDLYQLQNRQTVGQIQAETLDSLELGLRGDASGLRFDLSSYVMKKEHYFYRAADGTNVPNGKTLHRGVEVGMTSPLPGDFDIGLSASYALHTYDFDRPDSSAINVVRKGAMMPNAPRALASLRLGYSFLPDMRLEGEWAHMGPYVTDNAGTHSYKGHELFNLRLRARINDKFDLYGKILNIADQPYADRAAITTTGVDQYFPGSPRTFLMGLKATF